MSPEDDSSTTNSSSQTNHKTPTNNEHILDLDNNKMNMYSMLNEMDENHHNNNGKLNGNLKNGKLNHNNHNNHHHMNGNNGDIINNHNDNQVDDKICNGNNNGERRDSASNVWSPLLQKTTDDENILIKNGDNNKIINNNNNNNNNNNGTTIIYDPNNKNINDDWKDNEEINNLRNKFHKNNHHLNNNNNINNNNNGTTILINGNNKKNGSIIINDKLMEEHDPLTGKKNNIYDDNNSNISSYDNTTTTNTTQTINNNNNNNDDDDSDTNCGLFGFKPKWGKSLASTHVFMIVFLLAWVFQGMFLTYFVSVITTIEKLFQFKSRTTGMLLSASEIGQISTAMLLTYYAGRGHRPRWIACGMVLFSFAAFGCALPHFIFGRQLMQSSMFTNGENMMMTTTTLQNGNILKNTNLNNINMTTAAAIHSTENLNLCSDSYRYSNESNECEEEIKLEQASHSKITTIVLCIFFVSLLSSGIGQTAVSTLGIPYIDDNVASRNSPIYMAITIGVRILGPATGFIIGSFCTRIFVDLSTPSFDSSDPRWISAWWLGPVCIGSLMLTASIAMFSFPKHLRGHKSDQDNNDNKTSVEEETPKLKDFPKTVRRQFSNDILMFRTASSVFHILPIAGLYTFLPKYLETQFRLAAADANLMTAFGGILVMGVGIVISGFVILKLNPTAKTVAGWIAFTALVYSCGMAVLMFVGCNMNHFEGFTRYSSENHPGAAIFEPACNITCSCDLKEFSPICGSNGRTYFSSCHAGCSVAKYEDDKPVYYDCECIPQTTYIFDNVEGVIMPEANIFPLPSPKQAVGGYCDNNCQNFIYFICIFAFCVFMHSTSEVGSMLLIMRCTDPKDKAMAMGVIHSAIGLFGNVPCPIIYGAVIDSACLVWKTVCGKPGACSLYDTDSFRFYFLGITSSIMFIAFIMDLIVWSKAHRIDIAPQDNTSSSTAETDMVKPINASASDTSV